MADDSKDLAQLAKELQRRIEARRRASADETSTPMREDADAGAESPAGPACDLIESEGEYHLVIELPGVRAEDVSVTISGREVVVTAARRDDDSDGLKPVRVEQLGARRQRTVTLPGPVDPASLEHRLHGGLLEVKLGKA
ncbi:MAG: Hsp20/alpha crystallin family protein [Deltaproteobacteria bacterium]|nr:Hsp20/alpha crystallin family protein [Deltaproteobacteria bacterium]MCB9479053.1 Hsp20/alpha crystallin family protein [Deltaproteobacteria bacterium]MCB9488115.1 Hsp20/alpha crystallin family protein [Deltaproteobacteria bacterium]